MRMALVAVLLSLSLPALAQYEPPLGARHAVAGPRTSMLENAHLRMAANIRGRRHASGHFLLNIVGSSHKPWFDQWARQMADVEVVSTAPVPGR